jgi:two-component system, OmpR family, copper resistance phosphate regulon response regulator CusR
MRLLLVEDDKHLSASLSASLSDEEHAVDAVFNGAVGEDYAETGVYDIVILDVALPQKNGIELCRSLRGKGMSVPVIMLTARDTVHDRIRGLDSGADDYLVKPFAFHELLARLRALMRRPASSKPLVLKTHDLTADPATHLVERAGQRINLTAREFALLEYFMRNAGQVLCRRDVEEHLWSYDFVRTSNVVDVYVRRLRQKIDDGFETRLLETIYGRGYRLIV